ncbi:MAG: C10 family peptidase, partial [Bacteroidales bacterium]|nr:C10 family peptidase [Bacteroidales bacterium]
MKKILLLFVAVLFATSLFAENVNQNKAKQVAKAFASQRDRNAAQLKTDIVDSHPMPNKRDAAFYVVNLGDTGFVIVSANDVAHPVIGYSFDSPWPTEGNIPPQITDYLDDLAGQIEAASQNQPDQATKTEWQELLAINLNNPPQPKGNRTEVGPLLTTTWDQGQYYNNMTPETGSGHAVTGCVATAMAQIINYHEYPASG